MECKKDALKGLIKKYKDGGCSDRYADGSFFSKKKSPKMDEGEYSEDQLRLAKEDVDRRVKERGVFARPGEESNFAKRKKSLDALSGFFNKKK